MTMSSKANYDLIIFGASGYTGQYVIEYVYRAVELDLKNQLGDKRVKLKWAVAGRSMDKLAKVLMAAHLSNPGFDHGSIDMIFCDVNDEGSINDMAAQTKILLNCVGPYRYAQIFFLRNLYKNDFTIPLPFHKNCFLIYLTSFLYIPHLG